MVERRPLLDAACHVLLLLGVILSLAPLYMAFVSATLTIPETQELPPRLLPGDQLLTNIATAWGTGHFARAFLNSALVAAGITVGKIAVSMIAAFAITYFRFPFRMTAFWLIFVSLMVPVEVRIVPTYESVANLALPLQWLADSLGVADGLAALLGHTVTIDLQWSLLDSYAGLILPLTASATATFLFRQFFLTVPDTLLEAARMDGAGPLGFFWTILLPLSRANMAALAIILFLASWNQYLWPLLFTTSKDMATAIIALKDLIPTSDMVPAWNVAMAGALLTVLPPIAVVLVLQRWFVQGLINGDR
jgi:sn-glycerol 3-phosphate transport system permease protein